MPCRDAREIAYVDSLDIAAHLKPGEKNRARNRVRFVLDAKELHLYSPRLTP